VVRPPLPAGTVWGVGLNYHAKAAVTGRAVPDFPILFVKPATALAAPGDAVAVPAQLSSQVDYEAEVGIVIGRTMHEVAAERVWDHVAGLVTANDFTCRDIMAATKTPLLAKGLPGFAPLGPSVLPITEVADRDDVRVRSWVNGEQRQDGRTSDLIFPVAELLSIISRYGRLEPGDVVLTGTPPGTGQDLGRYLVPGDEVTAVVDDMLPLVTPVAASEREPLPV
jgi:2-keto-4-pentenoate hydratase/2-oxohepta-3-ene-1,7-dioic acid hydratase in catechol pathway